ATLSGQPQYPTTALLDAISGLSQLLLAAQQGLRVTLEIVIVVQPGAFDRSSLLELEEIAKLSDKVAAFTQGHLDAQGSIQQPRLLRPVEHLRRRRQGITRALQRRQPRQPEVAQGPQVQPALLTQQEHVSCQRSQRLTQGSRQLHWLALASSPR